MRAVRFLLPLLFVALISTHSASSSAQSFVDVTACDSTSVNGQLYGRVTFGITNQKAGQSVIYRFVMHPVSNLTPDDTCHVLGIVPPAGWAGSIIPDGKVHFYADPMDNYIPIGGTLPGFQVIISRPVCCYIFSFSGPFDEPFAFERVCLPCDHATPSLPETWGRLKQQYR